MSPSTPLTSDQASMLLDECVRLLSAYFEAVQIIARLPSKVVCTSGNGDKIKLTPRERFESKLDKKGGPDSCWLWKGHVNISGGHGQMNIGGRLIYSHRLAWQFAHGDIPDGMCVCHKCDVPKCCNPAHLFLGTASENFADMRRKGRGGRGGYALKGVFGFQGKLSSDDLTAIRAEYSHGNVTQVALAKRYKVSTPTIIAALK